MPAVRVSKNQKLVRGLGLLASASILSLLMAGEAQAACVPSLPDPLNNITTDGNQVSCTGPNTGQTIGVNANLVLVEVSGATGTLNNSTVTINGNNNTLQTQSGGVLNNLTVNANGDNNNIVLVGGASSNVTINNSGTNGDLLIGSNITNLTATLTGDQMSMSIFSPAVVTAVAGNINLSAGAGQAQIFSINSGATLTGTAGPAGAYLVTGGAGNQTLAVAGNLNVQANGLAFSGGAGDDQVIIAAGANLAVSGGANPMVFDGGADFDTMSFVASGTPVTRNVIANNFETGIFNSGISTLTMRGTGSYNLVSISGSGIVKFDELTALGSNTANVIITNTATAELAQFGTFTLGHNFSGTGTLTQSIGDYTYNGNSSGFSGTFNVNAANATLANANAMGTANIVLNSSSLTFGDFTLANNISGTGRILYTGVGTGDLTGNNTFSGGIDIRSGSLRVANVNALGTGAVTSTTGGVILQIDNVGAQTLANDITGDLVLAKTATGVLTLTGTNTYTGGTLIDQGGVRVDSFARLGTGQVVANANGSLILNYNGAGQLLQTTSFMTGAGSFIKEGSGDVVLDAANTYTGGTIIRAGRLGLNTGDALGTGNIQIDSGAELGVGGIILNNNLTGSGLVRKTASNVVEFYGDNSAFTGTIQIDAGQLFVTNGNSLGSGTLLINGGTSVQLDATTTTTVAASLSGAGDFEKIGTGRAILTGDGTGFSGAILINDGILQIAGTQNIGGGIVSIANAGTLQLDTANFTVFNNTVLGGGNLIKTGTGTVFVATGLSHTGGTDIQQGAIRVTDVSFLGTGPISVQAGAALDLSIATAQTLTSTVTGAGILRKSNTGDLTLLSNGLTGGVDIVGGRVLVGSAAALGGGPVTTAADTQLVFTNATTEVMSNLISGAGGLTMNGTGSVVITNANTYTGGTLINSGRIGLNNGQGLGTGNVVVLSGATLGIGNVTLANNVSGAGQIVKTASGVGSLTGTNTHTGGVDIQGGSLDVTGNASLGTGTVSIASGAALNYTNNSATTFSNGLTGAGTFNKLGTGQLTFANNFSIGSLNLNAGRTRINTIGTGNVTVGANATLDGTGRIIGNLTNNGTVAPGNSIGTLTVQGNYTHNANSVLEIEFDGAGNIDLLDVTGNATLNGGTLRFVSIGGAEGQGGTFLRTGGTLTGTFTTVETLGALLPLAVVYEPNRAFMAPSVLTARPSTFNAQSFAAADTALGFIDSIGVGDVRHGDGNRLWVNGFGAWGKRSASGTTLAYDHDTRGLSGGINFAVGDAVTLGAAIGWAKGDITLGANGGGGDQSSLLGSLTARYSGTGFTLGGGMLYGKVDQDTLRNVSFNGFSGSVDGSTDSKIFGGFAELGLPLGSAGGFAFSANARGSYIRQKQDGYTESGTSPLRLTLGDLKTSTLEGQAKLTAKTSLWDGDQGGEETSNGLDLRVDLGARYLGTLGDREIPVTFAVSNAGIVLQGDTRNTLQGLFGLALDYTTRGGVTLSAGYRGEVGKTDRHAVQAGVSFAF